MQWILPTTIPKPQKTTGVWAWIFWMPLRIHSNNHTMESFSFSNNNNSTNRGETWIILSRRTGVTCCRTNRGPLSLEVGLRDKVTTQHTQVKVMFQTAKTFRKEWWRQRFQIRVQTTKIEPNQGNRVGRTINR